MSMPLTEAEIFDSNTQIPPALERARIKTMHYISNVKFD